MGKLLGEEKERQRQLYFAATTDVIRGMSVAKAAEKHGRGVKDIRFRVNNMMMAVYRIVYKDTDYVRHDEPEGYLTIRQIQEHPDYWVRKLYEHQDKVPCNNSDRDNIWANLPASSIRLEQPLK
jgi:hypothetical protein